MERHDYFFEPWIGERYGEGFKGMKTLVVGSCHLCTLTCEFRKQCSSPHEVWAQDDTCPHYSKHEDRGFYRLRNSNIIEITSFIDGDAPYPTYKLFSYYLLGCNGDLSSEKKRELWDHVAFTNFLQSFHDDPDALPSGAVLYEEAYHAFFEVMERLNPEVVYVWNESIKECLKTHKEDFYYIGKAGLSFGIALYVFRPMKSRLTGTRLDKLRYRLDIKSEKHRLGWYIRLLNKHIGSCISESSPNEGKTINRLARGLMDLVDDGILGATEDGLYFKDSDKYNWDSQLKGFFLISVRQAFDTFGRGFNSGMEAIFGERLATNRRNPNESNGIAKAIKRTFPIHPANNPLKKT